MLEIAALVVVKKFRKMNARWRFPKFVRALSDDLSLTSMLEYDGERPILSLNERRLIVDQSRVSGRHLWVSEIALKLKGIKRIQWMESNTIKRKSLEGASINLNKIKHVMQMYLHSLAKCSKDLILSVY